MHPHDFLLAILAFFSELLGTISGFGSSTFFIPLGVLLETLHLVMALTALLHCFGNTAKMFFFRAYLSPKLFLQLGIPSIILSGIGAYLNSELSMHYLQRALGFLLIILAFLHFFRPRRLPQKNTILSSAVCGVSGFITGLLGTGGAIRGMALASLALEKNSFVALSASIDLGGDFLRAVIYLYGGYMDWQQWFYLPLLMVAAILGTYFGKKALKKIPQKFFEKIVAVFVLFSGLLMLFE